MQETPTDRPVRKRRWWWLPILVLVLAATVWLLPGLVAHTRLLRWVLDYTAADLKGAVAVKSASLGWFSPVVVQGIELRDAQDQVVLQAAGLKSSKPLAAILLNLSMLGEFQVERPRLMVLLRKDGSNVEDVLASYLAPGRKSSFSGIGFTLKIVDGSVSVTDENSRQTWQIEKLQLALSMSADAAGPTTLEMSAVITDPQHPGRFTARLSMRQPDVREQPSNNNGELTIEADAVPLAMFESLIGRFAPQTQLEGRLSSRIRTKWGGETSVHADLTANQFVLATPALGTDQVRLDQLHATCQITQQADRVQIKQSSLDCDLGNVSAAGSLELGETWSENLPAWVVKQTCEITGRVDLARLADMLPTTLRIRRETQVTSGQVQLALISRSESQGMVWQGRIETSDLAAVHRDRKLAWERPILITLAARDTEKGPVIENLKCESDFLKLHAAGTPGNFAASASFSLRQLANQLGQFVDLGVLGLGGDGWAQFNWERGDGQNFEADLELQLRDFQLAMPDQQPWTEENLLLVLSAGGQTDFGADTRLQSATLQIKAGEDRIDVRLTQPVLDFRRGGTWPVKMQMHGKLEHWPRRIATWVDMSDCKLAGDYQLTAEATGSIDRLDVRQASLAIQQFQLQTSRLKLNEPSVHLAARGQYERRTGMLRIEHLEVASAAISGKAAGKITRTDDQTNVQLDGEVSWQRTDLYGFQVDPGQLKATLADGILQAEPMDLSVGRGRLLLAPRVRVAPEPMEFSLPPGPLARQVQISPQMCASVLKYIAPVLAGVTTARGTFSIELQQCRIPLADPAKGELAGRLVVHSVEVGPGPLVRELAVLLGRATPARLRRESIVPFQMADGRVHHQGLELEFPDLTIRTHGSVGLDQTLALMAEMPVPPKWLGNNVIGSALRGQTIRLPIAGTLNKPQIDRRVLDQLSRQFLEKAAQNLIEDEVKKGLERLFRPPDR